jgi:hypothetical protein
MQQLLEHVPVEFSDIIFKDNVKQGVATPTGMHESTRPQASKQQQHTRASLAHLAPSLHKHCLGEQHAHCHRLRQGKHDVCRPVLLGRIIVLAHPAVLSP